MYDWTYSLLTPEEKAYFVAKFIDLAKNHTDSSYPPALGGSAVTGHRTENTINRDFLSAGVAIFDEMDEMYYLSAKNIEFVPARNFLFDAGMHYQGDSYGQLRYSYPMLLLIWYSPEWGIPIYMTAIWAMFRIERFTCADLTEIYLGMEIRGLSRIGEPLRIYRTHSYTQQAFITILTLRLNSKESTRSRIIMSILYWRFC